MNDDLHELIERALELPVEARAVLAGSLFDSLDVEVDEDAVQVWQVEIDRRIESIDRGDTSLVSWAEARRRILADG